MQGTRHDVEWNTELGASLEREFRRQEQPPARTGRGWKWGVAGLSLALLAASGYAGYAQLRSSDWRAEAEAARAEVTAAEATISELETEHDARVGEIADLESQVQTLANEKAQIEDERTAAQADSDYFLQSATDLAVAGEGLDLCIFETWDWMGATPDFSASDSVWNTWSADGDSVVLRCDAAITGFWETYDTLFGA